MIPRHSVVIRVPDLTPVPPFMQGDNDPVDVVEIGSKPCQMGGVFRVKPLGEAAALWSISLCIKWLPVQRTGPCLFFVLVGCMHCVPGAKGAMLMDRSCTEALHSWTCRCAGHD